MTKRNFILFVIALAVLVVGLLTYWYITADDFVPGQTEPAPSFLSRFNPFKRTATPGSPTPSPTTPDEGELPVVTDPEDLRLKKISTMSVAGYTVFQKERLKEVVEPIITEGVGATSTKPKPPETEFAPALRYVARSTGNIYQTFADKISERKFSATLVPQIYEAFFGNNGNSVIMRYLKADDRTIETFYGVLPKEVLGADTATENEITGSFLPENITDLSVSRDATKIFYMFESGEGVAGVTMDLTTGKKVQIFESAFTEWLSSWSSSKIITVTTKPSFVAEGHVYSLDPNTKVSKKLLGGVGGLTTLLSPDGKLVLYGNSTLALAIYNVDTKTSSQISLRTLPDKCIWGKDSLIIYCAVPQSVSGNQYPDTWYQGEVSFSDRIWKIDVATGNTELILTPAEEEGGEDVDAVKLSLDEKGVYLFFVNKKDSFLWEFILVQN